MIYLDTSIVVRVLAGEPQSLLFATWLSRQAEGSLWISQWTRTESAGALAAKVRGGSLRRSRLHQALVDLGTGPWLVLAVDPDDYDVAAEWAGRESLLLRGGDALHLAIARRAGLQTATVDRGMANAGRALGLAMADLPG